MKDLESEATLGDTLNVVVPTNTGPVIKSGRASFYGEICRAAKFAKRMRFSN